MIVPQQLPQQCSGIKATVLVVNPDRVKLRVDSAAACIRCHNGRGCGLGFAPGAAPSGEYGQRGSQQTPDSASSNAGAGAGTLTLASGDVRVMGPSGQVLNGKLLELIEAGEEVDVVLPRPALRRFIVLALLLPAFLMMIFSGIGHSLSPFWGLNADGAALLGVVTGFFTGAFLARLFYLKATGNTLDGRPVYLIPERIKRIKRVAEHKILHSALP